MVGRRETRSAGLDLERTGHVARVARSTDRRGKDEARILPCGAGRKALLELATPMALERLAHRRRQDDEARARFRLGFDELEAFAQRDAHLDDRLAECSTLAS